MIAVSRLCLLLVATLVACKGDQPPSSAPPAEPMQQSFDEAMRLVCDAPEQADLPDESTGATNRALALAAWLDQRVRNQEVRQLMGSVAAQESSQGKIDALMKGAKRAGIERCSLADLWGSGAARDGGAGALPSEPQTYDEAIAVLCDGQGDMAAVAVRVSERITNPEVAELFSSLAKALPAERVKRLRTAAAKSGVAACPLADRWDVDK